MSCICTGFDENGMCFCMRQQEQADMGGVYKPVTIHFTTSQQVVNMKPLSQRFHENLTKMLDDVRKHITGTQDPNYHYVASGTQTIDTWDSRGTLSSTALDTATKYLDRYGRKEGKNPKDLLKAIHYLLMVYFKDHNDHRLVTNNINIKPYYEQPRDESC